MDTDALLAEIRHHAEEYLTHEYVESARDLAKTVQLLDVLLSDGEGRIPAAWAEAPR